MGRMVSVYEGIGCEELERNVLREFRMDEVRFGVTLSYWPPTSLELATGIRTPPVLVTSDGAVKYFFQHLKVKGGMNLFARFEAKHQFVDTDVVDDSGMGFVSPDAVKFSSRSSRKGYVSSSASKTKVINLADDVDFVQEVEKVEEKLMGESHEGESIKDVADSCFSAGTEAEGTLEEDLEEIEARPRGYDEEFWKPMLAGDYGGSNVVDLVFNEDEIVEGVKKKSGPRSYFCDTGSFFDHYVEVGGQGGDETKANVMKPEDYNPWMGAGTDGLGVPYETLCGHWYKTSVWRETYAGMISPEEYLRDVDIPEEVSSMVLYPPITKRQAGRRRKTRIPSTGEIRVPKKKQVQNRCGRCGGFRHNRTNCVNPIWA
ncbi:hypothetical protein F2Q68_00045500 [Brassica cretica]|uniref:Uncharacterized protein n=1 Tax=Brassica cretica TaxID=69181 RepID=A0A8S9LT16_BRACR|nr:hypothetical protein F2Q68_00045500 [Brassica cretica]